MCCHGDSTYPAKGPTMTYHTLQTCRIVASYTFGLTAIVLACLLLAYGPTDLALAACLVGLAGCCLVVYPVCGPQYGMGWQTPLARYRTAQRLNRRLRPR
jgi:hypothetical protein